MRELRRRPHEVRFAFAIVIMTSLGLIGCEENLAPREEIAGMFSMWGILTPDRDTQSVRIYIPEEFLTLGSPTELEADVFSTDLVTGERRIWRDSVVVDPNGQHEHIFWSPFRAEQGHTYRVEAARRLDDARSVAEVGIPGPVSIRILDVDSPRFTVRMEGEAVRMLRPEAIYEVNKHGCPTLRFNVSYEAREKSVGTDWEVTIDMVIDQDEMLYFYNGEVVSFDAFTCGGGCPSLRLKGLLLRLLVGDAAWDPPGGSFDPNVLSQEGLMSNVENGFGFVGGGYRLVEPLFPSRKAVEGACFVYD